MILRSFCAARWQILRREWACTRLCWNRRQRNFLADMANGDARAALNAVELGILTTERAEDGLIHIDLDVAQECIQKRAVRYDKGEDNHYDTISAFIKSMRGSDPDAAVYYLARMLYAGRTLSLSPEGS